MLTGVTGTAHANRHAAEFGVGVTHVVHVGGQAQSADNVGRLGALHREHRIGAVFVGDGQARGRALLQSRDDGGSVGGIRH